MKRFILAGLTTLTLSAAIVPAVKAEPTAYNPYPTSNTRGNQLSPAALATIAYRGGLQQQGIPGYLGFSTEYALGRVTAKEVVKSAIQANLLPTEVANDQGYLNALDSQLQTQVIVR